MLLLVESAVLVVKPPMLIVQQSNHHFCCLNRSTAMFILIQSPPNLTSGCWCLVSPIHKPFSGPPDLKRIVESQWPMMLSHRLLVEPPKVCIPYCPTQPQTEQGMPFMRQMRTDLMPTAGMQADLAKTLYLSSSHPLKMFLKTPILFLQIFIELDDGKIYRKPLYLMVKTMVSCRFSLKPIHWTIRGFKQPYEKPWLLGVKKTEGLVQLYPQKYIGYNLQQICVLRCDICENQFLYDANHLYIYIYIYVGMNSKQTDANAEVLAKSATIKVTSNFALVTYNGLV